MTMTGKRWPRYFAILVALIMAIETIVFTMTSYAKNDIGKAYELTNEDKTTVSEISNMTGVKAEEIIKLRTEGKSWNEILETLRNNPGYKAEGDNTKRNGTLAQNGMEEGTLKKLKEEGFSEQEIAEAKSMAERVVFQLEEITSMQAVSPSLPEAGINISENKEEDVQAYTALAGKISINEAVYLILKLHSELGSMQAVLDEYLYSLQIGIDLKEYLSNKEEYSKHKQQKAAELAAQEVITAAKIEEKLLQQLQSMNKKDETTAEVKANVPSLPDTTAKSPLPDVPVPGAQDVKPQNPAEAILQEIQGIKNSGMGQEGR